MTIDIDAIRTREAAATKGPWTTGASKEWSDALPPWALIIDGSYPLTELQEGPQGAADAEFIAHARTDVPALLARVDEQDAEIQRLRAVAEAVTALATEALQAVQTNPLHTDLAIKIRAALGGTKVEPVEPQYLIWSHHHKAWFGPNESGYRSHIADAGRYDLADTKQWLGRICGCCVTPEVAVPAPPLVTFQSPSGLAQFAKEQIHNATARRIGAGQVNTYAAISEITR